MSMESHGGMILSRGNFLIYLPELSGIFYQQSHLVAKQENMAKEMMNFAYEISLSYS